MLNGTQTITIKPLERSSEAWPADFRLGAPPVEAPPEPETKPDVKPTPAEPERRDNPAPFTPPDPGRKSCPGGDPNKRHTVCRM